MSTERWAEGARLLDDLQAAHADFQNRAARGAETEQASPFVTPASTYVQANALWERWLIENGADMLHVVLRGTRSVCLRCVEQYGEGPPLACTECGWEPS